MADDFGMGYALGQDSNGGSNGVFGDGSWWIVIILFAMIFGWGNGGFGGFGGGGSGAQGALTRSDLCSEFAFNDLQSGVRGLSQGICDSTFALNSTITNGFHGTDNAICNLGYQTAQLVNGINTNMTNGFTGVTAGITALGTQMSDCCCATQRQIERGFCDTNYNMANNTRDIMQSAHNDTDRIISRLDAMENARQQERIAALQSENQSLKFMASQSEQNAFIQASQSAQTAELIRRCCPSPVPAYQVPAPYPYCGPVNYGCGCGC